MYINPENLLQNSDMPTQESKLIMAEIAALNDLKDLAIELLLYPSGSPS